MVPCKVKNPMAALLIYYDSYLMTHSNLIFFSVRKLQYVNIMTIFLILHYFDYFSPIHTFVVLGTILQFVFILLPKVWLISYDSSYDSYYFIWLVWMIFKTNFKGKRRIGNKRRLNTFQNFLLCFSSLKRETYLVQRPIFWPVWLHVPLSTWLQNLQFHEKISRKISKNFFFQKFSIFWQCSIKKLDLNTYKIDFHYFRAENMENKISKLFTISKIE